jgi:hypothetical protein
MITLTLNCKRCGTGFDVSAAHHRTFRFTGLPTICPTCNDREQGRPTIVLQRETIWDGVIRIGESASHLLRDLQPFCAQAGDSPCWKMTVKGARYGHDWHGRLDIYSHVDPSLLVQDAVVLGAYSRAVKEVWIQTEQRQTMEHGICRVRHRVDPATEGAEKKVEEDTYFVILPIANGEVPVPIGSLVYAKAYSKTTLKGFGRQFSAAIHGTPIWGFDFFGGYRSGRAGTATMLAVQADDAPLTVEHHEGGAVESYEVK